jgi:hypothetical protein
LQGIIGGVAVSLYKHPNGRKGERCEICAGGTRGPATLVRLAYGVVVSLCGEHASPAFQTKRHGRDFVLTLQRVWSAGGLLTRRRRRALDAHLAAVAGANVPPRRRRPGSYCWPELRDEAELRCARGEEAETIVRDLRRRRAPGICMAPSVRTIRRWLSERRWIFRAPDRPPRRAPIWPAMDSTVRPPADAPLPDLPDDDGRAPPAAR